MNNISTSEQTAVRGLYGVFPIDHYGTVGEVFGMWHHSMAEAEQYLKWVTAHYGKNYTVLSKVEHDTRLSEQQTAGRAFKTGHDLLMDEFDQWLKKNNLIRGTEAAARMGLSDKEFKAFVKKGLFKRQYMPDHDNLAGFSADISLTDEQQQQFMNAYTLNAHQVAEGLGITHKEFTEIKRQANIAHSAELLGRTVPNDSGTAPLFSRVDIEKLRPIAQDTIAKRPKPAAKIDAGK